MKEYKVEMLDLIEMIKKKTTREFSKKDVFRARGKMMYLQKEITQAKAISTLNITTVKG